MTADLTVPLVPLILIGALVSCGVYLLLERNLTRMLLGLLLIGNGISRVGIAPKCLVEMDHDR